MKKKSDTEWDDRAADIARKIDEQESKMFTDDDLKRLKESIGEGYGWWHEQLKTKGLQALLARLEAAEIICQSKAGEWPDAEDVKVWRKAKCE